MSPGQGQNVTVSGVQVGEITKVETEDGLAVVTVQLDPDEVGPIYSNATMYLRPKTGLNDMTIQLDPGRPEAGTEDGGRLGDGDRIGIAQTTAQAVELLHGGAPGIHFYTLNQSPATRIILTALKTARLA